MVSVKLTRIEKCAKQVTVTTIYESFSIDSLVGGYVLLFVQFKDICIVNKKNNIFQFYILTCMVQNNHITNA